MSHDAKCQRDSCLAGSSNETNRGRRGQTSTVERVETTYIVSCPSSSNLLGNVRKLQEYNAACMMSESASYVLRRNREGRKEGCRARYSQKWLIG